MVYNEAMENNRVAKVIEVATRNGYSVRKSEVAEGCWVIDGQDRSLLVYAGSNHSCTIFLTTGFYMSEITQRQAKYMMATKTL